MTTRLTLLVGWLALAAAPPLWWLVTRRRVDVWRALPVPAALLDRRGAVRATTGPAAALDFTAIGGLPPAGRLARGRAPDGTPVAIAGVRGGALAVALPADPLAERRDRVLAELGARLAHDINTPLGALHGHLDLIAHEPISAPAKESVRTCQRELVRLQTTAQDLLTFTRLRAGGGVRSVVLAGALVEESAAALLDRADELGATLTVEVPSERVQVEVVEADLVRALRNLVHNALSYGLGRAASVRVLCEAGGEAADTVTFTVVDSGPGLSPQQLAELSQPLVRGDGVLPTGSGLGLAIVAEVLGAHGSRLETGRTADPDGVERPHLRFALPRARG